MDNMRMDCSYLVLSLARHLKCLTLHWANFKRIAIFFFLRRRPLPFDAVAAKLFLNFYTTCTRATSMLMWATRLYLLVTNVITLGRREKPKVLKSSKWQAQGSVDFCISHLLYGFKKTGERGQLNIHIIWGYIQSLGFKLLDERQLWINVIFSLTYRHLLRARGKKKSLCALPLLIFLITLPWGSLSLWNARQWLSNVTDF